jgi:hypothetical protein
MSIKIKEVITATIHSGVAGAAMAFSSVSMVNNALLSRRWRPVAHPNRSEPTFNSGPEKMYILQGGSPCKPARKLIY